VVKVMEYLSREEIVKEFSERTLFLPAHKGVVDKGGLTSSDDKNVKRRRMDAFVKAAGQTCRADALPSWKWANAYYGALVTRLSQVMAGEMKIDDAWARIDQDIADKVAAGEVARMGPALGPHRRWGRSLRRSAGSPHHRCAAEALAAAHRLGGMAAFFLAPNMLIFGVFVLAPFVINFFYSTTGGNAFFPRRRTYVGAEQYSRSARLRQLSRTLDLPRRPVLERGAQHVLVCDFAGHRC
jgi:hypothetical protein